MIDILGEFEWFRDPKGYRIVPFSSFKIREHVLKGRDVEWVVPKGAAKTQVSYQPFARGGDLCTAFASVKTREELLNFIHSHGLLTSTGEPPFDPAFKAFPAGEPVPLGLANAEMFRELLTMHALAGPKELAAYFQAKIAGFVGGGQAGRVEILPDPVRGVRLRISPPTLLGALWYQLALKLSDANHRMCPLCNRIFEVGPGTKLRTDAKFCCHEHKVEYFNRKRSKMVRRTR
jgi:hypothetical protein